MEKQENSILHQKNRKRLTAVCIAGCILTLPLASIFAFVPQVLCFLPMILLAMIGYAGPVSAAVCSLLWIAVYGLLCGGWGSMCMATLLVPTVLISSYTADQKKPFWEAVAAGSAVMFASMGMVVAMLTVLAGSDLVSALTEGMVKMFAGSGERMDSVLSLLVQMGVLDGLEGGTIGQNPELREELTRALALLVDSTLRLELPRQMATGAVTAGLLGQALLRKGLMHRGMQTEYPSLKTWRVPKGWGRILGGTLAILYVLAILVPQSMKTMFYVFSGVFDKVFALQGIASIAYLLDKKKAPRIWKGIVFLLGYSFLGNIVMAIGVMDQIFDFTHRREELDKDINPFDPKREG